MAKLHPDEVARFHQLLERLVAAGVPLPPALEQLGADLQGKMKDEALEISRQLADGRSLGAAMAERGFPPLYAEMISAAEGAEGSSGTLAEVLGHVSRHAAAAARIRRQIADSLMYPLLLAAGAIVLFIHIISGLAGDVRAFGIALRQNSGKVLGAGTGPLPVDSGSLAVAVLIFSVSVLVAAAIAVRLGRIPTWGYRAPLIGRALRAGEIAAVLRTLALLVGAGRRPESAFALAAETTSWPALSAGAREAAKALEAGEPFAPAMEKLGALPGEMRWLLVGAWQQGENFPAAAAEVADAAESEAADLARRTAVTVEVLVLAIAGLAVLAVGAMTYIRLNTLVDYLSVTG